MKIVTIRETGRLGRVIGKEGRLYIVWTPTGRYMFYAFQLKGL